MVICLLPYIHTFLLAVVNYNFYTKKMHIFALTSVAQLVGYHPSKQKVVGLILVRAHAWVAGSSPDGMHTRPIHISLSHQCFSVSPSPSLPLSLKINKIISLLHVFNIYNLMSFSTCLKLWLNCCFTVAKNSTNCLVFTFSFIFCTFRNNFTVMFCLNKSLGVV